MKKLDTRTRAALALLLIVPIAVYFTRARTSSAARTPQLPRAQLTPPTPPPPSINGSWKVTQVTCNGDDSNTVPQADLQNNSAWATAMVNTNYGMGGRFWQVNGCTQYVSMSSVSATSSTVTFTDGLIGCLPSTCDSSCGSNGNTQTFNYSLSMDGNTLTLTVSDYSPYFDPCAGQSGPIVVTYQRLS